MIPMHELTQTLEEVSKTKMQGYKYYLHVFLLVNIALYAFTLALISIKLILL